MMNKVSNVGSVLNPHISRIGNRDYVVLVGVSVAPVKEGDNFKISKLTPAVLTLFSGEVGQRPPSLRDISLVPVTARADSRVELKFILCEIVDELFDQLGEHTKVD